MYSNDGPFIKFIILGISFQNFNPIEFNASIIARIKDPDGYTILSGSDKYSFKLYGRDRKWSEFEADDGKLLREEMKFAAVTMAMRFINLFKSEK